MPKSRVSALLSVLLVFFSGAVLGAFVYRLYATSPVQSSKDPTAAAPPRRMTPEEWRRNYIANLSKAAKLDDQQTAALNGVLDETRDEVKKLDEKFRPERDAIQNHQVASINAILRPDQRPLYESWRAERERLHKQRDQHKK
jgi:uncharacterized membrane protein